jgi:hypothetical protein
VEIRWLFVVAVGCFHPSYDRPTCGANGECPSGLVCLAGTCERAGGPAPQDASSMDVPGDADDPGNTDGDGVNAGDNCPAVANADQSDGDGDLVGDACDSCVAVPNPPRATPGSTTPIQRDHDADGRGDDCDPCPHLASSLDVDTDADGIGDACDPEPTIKNPPAYFNGFYDPPGTVQVASGGS